MWESEEIRKGGRRATERDETWAPQKRLSLTTTTIIRYYMRIIWGQWGVGGEQHNYHMGDSVFGAQ